MRDNNLKTGKIIGLKYLVIKKIGSGSYGQIYLAKNIHTNLEVAIKTELKTSLKENAKSMKDNQSQLEEIVTAILKTKYSIKSSEASLKRKKWLENQREKTKIIHYNLFSK